jgi:hypothetical protein
MPGNAAAVPVSVGLLGIDGANVEPGMGQVLTEALYRHIPSLQGMRVEKSQQDLVEVKLVFGCTDENPACMAKVGRSLNVNRLIYGSIRKHPQGDLYVVSIKQLNVADSTVEKFISEAVPPEVLKTDNPQLSELVQRWLRVLLIEGLRGGLHVISEPPGASVQLDGIPVGMTPLTMPDVDVGEHLISFDLADHVSVTQHIRIRGGLVHEVTAMLPLRGSVARAAKANGFSRAMRITSYVTAGLAGAFAIAAIGTWRGYVSAEDGANSALDQLQQRLTSNGTVGMYRGFLTDSGQLSGCAQVAGLQADMNYQGYLSQCQTGNNLARATTGLWVMAGGFAVISITTALLSALRHPAAETVQDNSAVAPVSPASAPASAPPSGPSPAPAAAPEPSAAPAPPGPQASRSTGLRLVDIIPNVGPDGAALSAQFRF